MTCEVSPFTSHRYPSMIPIPRRPRLAASIVAEAITPLIPGAGPPPTRIASVCRPDPLSFIAQPLGGLSSRDHKLCSTALQFIANQSLLLRLSSCRWSSILKNEGDLHAVQSRRRDAGRRSRAVLEPYRQLPPAKCKRRAILRAG